MSRLDLNIKICDVYFSKDRQLLYLSATNCANLGAQFKFIFSENKDGNEVHAEPYKVIPQYCIALPYCERFWKRNSHQAELDSELDASFLLNEHGNLYFYCIIIVFILFLKNIFFVERKKRYTVFTRISATLE